VHLIHTGLIEELLRGELVIHQEDPGMPRVAEEGTSGCRIRPMDPTSETELELVARRMRLTLNEVLGEEVGTALYSMEWLRQRVLWHLNPANCTGQVFLAEDADGTIVGHTIVRIDADDAGTPIGLFSTTYVAPEVRRRAVASRLLRAGEAWLIGHGMTTAVTATSAANVKLIKLYEKHGYVIVGAHADMVRLGRALSSDQT
jgi:GNAT superfamily N-acetyltransferase